MRIFKCSVIYEDYWGAADGVVVTGMMGFAKMGFDKFLTPYLETGAFKIDFKILAKAGKVQINSGFPLIGVITITALVKPQKTDSMTLRNWVHDGGEVEIKPLSFAETAI